MSFHKSESKTPLAPPVYAKIPPVITSYDPKKQNAATRDTANFIYAKYKTDMSDVPAQQAAGSTLPLVQIPKDEEANDYDPFQHRKVPRPTSDIDTLIHLLKGSLGSGILSMPYAFLNAGLFFGLIATLIVGVICTYCVHILVKCAHILSRRRQIPSLGFADIAEMAFLDGPEKLHKYSRMIRFIVNLFLVIDLLGCCCVYIVFVALNVQQLCTHYFHVEYDVRLYIISLLLPLIIVNLVRNLKYLTPFSMFANILIGIGIVITLYYVIFNGNGLPSVTTVNSIADITHWPIFFGNVIFALEGIGVVMSLENNMKNPTHFIGCPGVLNFGMGFVVIMYASVGFLGYLKYGDDTKSTITLNLPTEEILAQSVKVMITLAIFFTYTLQFYVPMEIIWKNFKGRCNDNYEYVIRIGLVVATVAIAAAVPNLGPFISLIGAVCLSTLGLIIPALIETVVYWEKPGMGKFNWRFYKNIFLITFGIIGFLTGTYVSMLEIINGGSGTH